MFTRSKRPRRSNLWAIGGAHTASIAHSAIRSALKPRGWIFAFLALTTLQCGRESFDLLPQPSGLGGGAGEAGEGGDGTNAGSGGRDGAGGKFPGFAGFPGSGGGTCHTPGFTPLCTENICESCSKQSDCDDDDDYCWFRPGEDGQSSSEGYCVECMTNDDCNPDTDPSTWENLCNLETMHCAKRCAGGLGCADGEERYCVPTSSFGSPVSSCNECIKDRDCPDHRPFCHFGRCFECLDDCECASKFAQLSANAPVCNRGACECRSHADCPQSNGWRCDFSEGTCWREEQ
jgi:hypothetical protein